MKDWEQYEAEKSSLLQYLKKAETELEKPSETLAQDSAQKDFQSKKVSKIHNMSALNFYFTCSVCVSERDCVHVYVWEREV